MQPGFPPPPPFKRFMRKAMVNKASQMLIQLQVGAPSSSCLRNTLYMWEKYVWVALLYHEVQTPKYTASACIMACLT